MLHFIAFAIYPSVLFLEKHVLCYSGCFALCRPVRRLSTARCACCCCQRGCGDRCLCAVPPISFHSLPPLLPAALPSPGKTGNYFGATPKLPLILGALCPHFLPPLCFLLLHSDKELFVVCFNFLCKVYCSCCRRSYSCSLHDAL